jgi:prephenate dehydrogenase
MPLFKKAAVVGVGQIGGSLAWAIKKRRLAAEVTGVAKTSQAAAQKLGAIDRGYAPGGLAEALRGADLVVLALPVALNEAFVRDAAKCRLIDPKAVVIDVGSTKARIVPSARGGKLGPRFIGCHPMAGSEKSGALSANPDLFVNAVCFVSHANARVERLWRAVGAHPVRLDPAAHDRWVAHASHMPHLLAFLLFAGFPKGGGFAPNPSVRDLARISKSGPELWAEIFESNRRELLPASKAFEKNLAAFNRALARRDGRGVRALIREANRRSANSFPSDARKK